MRVFRVATVAICIAALMGQGAVAQIGLPPEDYFGNEFVDAAGCVFVRAEIGGQVTWVPRLSRDRQPVCGRAPTFPTGTAPAVGVETPPPDTGAAPVLAAPPPTAAEPRVTAELPAGQPVRRSAARGQRPIRIVRAGAIPVAETYCAGRIDGAQRYLLSDGRRVTRCSGEVAADPVAYLNALGIPGLTVAPGAPSRAEVRRAIRADAGAYRVVWANGKLTAEGEAARVSGKSARRMVAAPAATDGARYVQVGAFAVPANADRAIARLKALGLPVAVAREGKAGQPLRTILAGPFEKPDELRSALLLARQNGYHDAFPRR